METVSSSLGLRTAPPNYERSGPLSLAAVAIVSLLVLVAIFLLATFLPLHMGVLAISAAFVLGVLLLPGGFSGDAFDAKSEAIAGGFPGDLFVTLAGVTFLFAIAKNNGTVDWLVHAAVRLVAGRVALIPWVFFTVTAVLTAVGAVVPAAVAIIAPIGMTFARRYGIPQLLMGLMVINGATAGGFSPLSIFGSITNDTVARAGLDGSPLFLFLASLVFNVVLGLVTFALFGGRHLVGVRDAGDGELVAADGSPVRRFREGPAEQTGQRTTSASSAPPNAEPGSDPVTTLDVHRALTLVGMVVLTLGAFFFKLDVGFFSFLIGTLLCLLNPGITKGAVGEIAWPTVLLVCGIVTYVSLLQNPDLDPSGETDVISWFGEWAAGLGAVTVAALLVLYVGGVVSAFASTTGILRRPDPAGRALPRRAGGRARRGGAGDRPGDLLLRRRLLALLDVGCARGRERQRGRPRGRLPEPAEVGLLDGGHRSARHMAAADHAR